MFLFDFLKTTKLFQNMTAEEIQQALAFFSAQEAHYNKNEIIKKPIHSYPHSAWFSMVA